MSSDEEALAWGANTAILGREVIQFAAAMPIGAGQFRLSGLLRGRDGTESASAGHSADEWFVMVESDALRVIELPSFAIGTQVVARTIGAGSGSAEVQATIGWGGLRPLTGSALLLDGARSLGQGPQPSRRRPAEAPSTQRPDPRSISCSALCDSMV